MDQIDVITAARMMYHACSPLIPESAMIPVSCSDDNSSRDLPKHFFATGAAYLKLYCRSKIPAADWFGRLRKYIRYMRGLFRFHTKRHLRQRLPFRRHSHVPSVCGFGAAIIPGIATDHIIYNHRNLKRAKFCIPSLQLHWLTL